MRAGGAAALPLRPGAADPERSGGAAVGRRGRSGRREGGEGREGRVYGRFGAVFGGVGHCV